MFNELKNEIFYQLIKTLQKTTMETAIKNYKELRNGQWGKLKEEFENETKQEIYNIIEKHLQSQSSLEDNLSKTDNIDSFSEDDDRNSDENDPPLFEPKKMKVNELCKYINRKGEQCQNIGEKYGENKKWNGMLLCNHHYQNAKLKARRPPIPPLC